MIPAAPPLLLALLLALLAACRAPGGDPAPGPAPGPILTLEGLHYRLGAFERTAEAFRVYYATPVPPDLEPRDPPRAETFQRLRDDIALARAALQAALEGGADPGPALTELLRSLPVLVASRDPELVPIALGAQLLLELWLLPGPTVQ